ncbi:MAG: P1 family peptidase [Candidatus Rifleibacteriota bacterium]
MRITLTYNERTSDSMVEGELLTKEEIEIIRKAIVACGHEVIPLEASGPSDRFVEHLVETAPQLIFNVAEGKKGKDREARYPAIFEKLGFPFTGGQSSLLHVCLDKRLTEIILEKRGVRVPKGCLVTPEKPSIHKDINFPIFIKPNYEGSSKGISEDSIIEKPEEADKIIQRLLKDFPEGLDVEEFIMGRELTVPLLELLPGRFVEIVESVFDSEDKYNFYGYEDKLSENKDKSGIRANCPADLSSEERCNILSLANRVEEVLHCPDMGRIDIRLSKDGAPYFLEANVLPRLLPDGSLAIAAKARGMAYEDIFDLVIRSCIKRYGLTFPTKTFSFSKEKKQRPTAREMGVSVGRFPTGLFNAITDVQGVAVGHVSHIEDDIEVPGQTDKTTSVRTGITAICPQPKTLFHNHMVSGAFVLNGIGEMAGITQAQEWGWLETPILLTNTMSVGRVHDGIIQHLVSIYPELGREVEVTIPLVGETNDAFLNDVRIYRNTPEDAIKAITSARTGQIEQGSVGGGTGMMSFDFAGGIGSSSRVVTIKSDKTQDYTVGVIVQSNFGSMRNLTIDGQVVGRELDPLYPDEGRRKKPYGSVIVIVATDAPLMTPQLNRLCKRAALGLGRIGSHAASTSGEIIIGFSTGNQIPRSKKDKTHLLSLSSINDTYINPLYEAVIEATEESVLNAMFCSPGQKGQKNRFAPPIPAKKIAAMLNKIK